MPTKLHELPLEMVRNRPELVPELLRTVFNVDVPEESPATLTSESYADTNPAELRCDATVLLGEPDAPTLGVVVESQLRVKEAKSYSWPAYLASLRLRRKCPVLLLVICPDQATARGCAVPIDMGHPGWVLKPLTLSPEGVPPVTDEATARRLPELAVLSAVAHQEGPRAETVLNSLAIALGALPEDTRQLYHEHVAPQLSEVARKLLEESMRKTGLPTLEDYANKYKAEGEAVGLAKGEAIGQAKGEATGEVKGEAKALLLMLGARGVSVSDGVRERIRACKDLDQLERWILRAASVESVEELFD
ncbi:hypothetical protein [Actinomadura litoris]|uniref:hypothetical protein n=1 Tax=Actinomadura litoris TaxID=2678616 RepID=UPI001FA736CB|nr:hypothetical protein [Actinomadura litoris]